MDKDDKLRLAEIHAMVKTISVRTIEYVAPFDRCDREQDYETAWRFFEEKYGKDT